MRVFLLLVTAAICSAAALSAQAVGDPVPNKLFLSSWSTPTGVDELADYPAIAPSGKVLLIYWFGTFCGHCEGDVADFNAFHGQYHADGLEILYTNYANTDSDIQAFITTFGANYSFARVADDSGYTVPQFGTCFVVGQGGNLVWSGYSDTITNQMIEGWLDADQSCGCSGPEDDEDESEGCVARGPGSVSFLPALGLLMVICFQRARRVRILERKSVPTVRGLIQAVRGGA
jgi:hypothetical protein